MTLALAAACAGAAAWLALRPGWHSRSLLPVVRGVIAVIRQRLLGRRARGRVRGQVRDALAEVVADVRAGQPPARALERALASADTHLAPRSLAAVRWGGDIPGALRDDARSADQPLLSAAAACWSVAERGAGLADALDRVVQQDRKAEEVRRQLQAQLAAPRATARMLALLPLIGLGLGFAIGGDPLGWLLGTPFGWACLGLGLALTGLGLAWTSRIATRTERLL